MPTLADNVETAIAERFNWLKQAERARDVLDDLPEIVTRMENAWLEYDHTGKTTLTIYGKEHMRLLAKYGAVFEKPTLPTWDDHFQTKGMMRNIYVKVIHLDVPANCVVEKVPYTAYTYKAVCDKRPLAESV